MFLFKRKRVNFSLVLFLTNFWNACERGLIKLLRPISNFETWNSAFNAREYSQPNIARFLDFFKEE